MTQKELLIAWLNDAYALEKALVPVLENHAKDAKDHPKIQARDEEHLEETRRHAELVKGCLERLGETPSTAKQVLGTLFGAMQAPATGMYRDEIVKNFLTDFAAENFEIASYEALVHAAEEMGEMEIAATCRGILEDERRMASWLLENLPDVVREQCRQAAHAT